jgi:PAS domain S-box-containing protein
MSGGEAPCRDAAWRVLSWRTDADPDAMADSPLKSKGSYRASTELHGGAVSPHAHAEAASFVEEKQEGLPKEEGGGLYRLLVESVQDYAIFALDATGHVLSWNPGAQRFKGYTAPEILGKHFSIFYRPDDKWKTAYELEVAERDGRVEDEGWRVRKDGSLFWANVVITALRDKDGHLVGFAKVTRDLTERRAAERRIAESEERFRLIVTSVRDYGIFMLDSTGRVVSWNEGAEAINGYTATEIIGRHFSAFYPPEDIAAGKPDWELEIVAREGRFEDEGWRLRKDGSRFWANVVITALHNEAGSLIGFAKVTRDLTLQKAAEEREIEAARRAAVSEEANRTKSTFLAAMSHELRTPLNAIGGYADLLLMGVGGEVASQHREYLERIRASQQHLLSIINDILNFSRIEAGQLSYDIEAVSLCTVMDTVAPMIEPQAAAKRIRMERWHGPDATALADRAKTEQILLNLLSNAIKFTPSGGRVELLCATRDDQVILSVADTGIGIPAEKLGSIFEPFVQVGRSLTSPHEGTGLGLAISNDLANAMGGHLAVESTVGSGTTFTLTLPKVPD